MIGIILVLLAIVAGSAEASIAPECHLTTKELRHIAPVHRFWRETGHPRGWTGHVVDHICPLACGGLDDPINMQWQTEMEARLKDKIERTPDGYAQFCMPSP